MGSNSSSLINNIKNKKINKNDVNALNQLVNNFVVDSLIKNTNGCGDYKQQNDDIGDPVVVVSKNPSILENQSNKIVSLQCVQQAIQQINIGNDIGTAITNAIIVSIPDDILTNLVNDAENNMNQGMAAGILNPFASASSEVSINLSNTQVTDTNRKLSNLISNQVANSYKPNLIKDCFTKSAVQQNNNFGIIPQVSIRSYVNCSSLTETTMRITTNILNLLNISIFDDSIVVADAVAVSHNNSYSSPIQSCPDPYNVCPEKIFITQECPEKIFITQECPKQICPKQEDTSSWKIAVYILGGLLFICIIIVLILLLRKKKLRNNFINNLINLPI